VNRLRISGETIPFKKKIGPTTDPVYLYERVKDYGEVSEVRIRIYAGPEGEFKIRPFIKHKRGVVQEMVTYPDGSDRYVYGDNDYFIIPVGKEVAIDDEIALEVVNGTTYTYTLSVDVVMNYYERKGV
jgi:hypothetical protein